jgi:hypothetical protein
MGRRETGVVDPEPGTVAAWMGSGVVMPSPASRELNCGAMPRSMKETPGIRAESFDDWLAGEGMRRLQNLRRFAPARGPRSNGERGRPGQDV